MNFLMSLVSEVLRKKNACLEIAFFSAIDFCLYLHGSVYFEFACLSCLGALAKSARAAGLNASVAEKYAADALQALEGNTRSVLGILG